MLPNVSKFECPIKVLTFVCYTLSLLMCMLSISSNDWFVMKNDTTTFQIGLNDNCVVGESLKCAHWNEPSNIEDIFPVNPRPSSTLIFLNYMKWIPMLIVVICIVFCITALTCLRKSLEEIFKGKTIIIAFLLTGAICFISTLCLTYFIYLKSDVMFEFVSQSYEVTIGNAIGKYWISFTFYTAAITLYIFMMLSTSQNAIPMNNSVELTHLRAATD